MKMKKLALIVLSLTLFAGSAQAASLWGQIQLVGQNASYVTDASNNITGIDMGSNGMGNSDLVVVGSATSGAFLSLFDVYSFTTGLTATNNGLMYDIDLSASAVNPLWTIGTLTFAMTNFTSGPIASGFQVYGSGIITDSSGTYSDTTGYFSLNTTNTNTSLSFNFDTVTVPEPGALALIGLGLLGLGAARLKARRS